MSNAEAGPSSTPASVQSRGILYNGGHSRSPSAAESTDSRHKGKQVDRSTLRVRTISLSADNSGATTPIDPTPTPPVAAGSSTSQWSLTSPRPLVRSPTSVVRLAGTPPIRARTTSRLDSSDMDHVSYSPLPRGRPSPDPPDIQPPAAKRLKSTAPPAPVLTPLPSGPPSIQTLRILLQPDHVELNKPKRFFDYVRQRDFKPPQITLAAAELKEILEKMRKVNDIWLRTMGEDEDNLQCLAMWLKLFINSPKAFEGIIIPLLYVILRSKPSIERIKSARLVTLAKQALGKAKQNNLSKWPDIETAVGYLDKHVEKGRQARAGGAVDGTGKPALPSFKKNATGASGEPQASSSAGPSGLNAEPPTKPTAPTGPPEPTALQKLLAQSSAANIARERAAREAADSQKAANGQPPLSNGPAASKAGTTAGSSRPSPFQSVPGPTPMVIARPSSASSSTPASSAPASYPSPGNRWSSIATPAGKARPWDAKKKPNWRNCTIRYNDVALAEAREFEQAEVEEDEPDWWIYGTKGTDAHGHSTSELDQEEDQTMRHLAHAVPNIEWYDPLPYECTGSTVHAVVTPEVQEQEARERGQLSTSYYITARDIPLTPDERHTRMIDYNPHYGSREIPPPPAVYIPPPPVPQPYQANPYGWQNHQTPSVAQGGFNNIHPSRQNPALAQTPPSSSSFRPRSSVATPNNQAPQPTTPAAGSLSAYRPRATSAPPGPTPQIKAEPTDSDRRASTPGPSAAPKAKQWLRPSDNPAPLPDRAHTNHTWSKVARPRKSALLNPLTPAQVAENTDHLARAPPQDYSAFRLDDENQDDAAHQGGPPAAVSMAQGSKQ